MDEEYVELEAVDGRHVADLIQSYFKAHGIPMEISQESYGSTFALTVAPLGVAHLLVPESRLEEAQQLLAEYYSDKEDD